MAYFARKGGDKSCLVVESWCKKQMLASWRAYMSSSGYITPVNCFAKSESKSQLYKLCSARGKRFPVWYIRRCLQKGTMGFSTGLPSSTSLGRLLSGHRSSGTYRAACREVLTEDLMKICTAPSFLIQPLRLSWTCVDARKSYPSRLTVPLFFSLESFALPCCFCLPR